MIQSKLTITVIGLITVLISCNHSTKNNAEETKSLIVHSKAQIDTTEVDSKIKNESILKVQKTPDSIASEFVKSLQGGAKLSSYFNDHWMFLYHEDNRCDGATDGELNHLKSVHIDSIIRIHVKNDGEGWACEKKEPKTYDLDFELKKKIITWDRFEISDAEPQEKNIVYVLGAGASDYLKLHYNDMNMIIKLEYRSEDPG